MNSDIIDELVDFIEDKIINKIYDNENILIVYGRNIRINYNNNLYKISNETIKNNIKYIKSKLGSNIKVILNEETVELHNSIKTYWILTITW